MRSYIILIILVICISCSKADMREVVVYTSVDQVFSEPILKDFEKEKGIKVKAVYDVEAQKTTGLVNRLLAEKDRPKCDVFWNSEIIRTMYLKNKGLLAPYKSPSADDIPPQFKDRENYWTGFATRARILIYNTTMLKETELPKSIFDLTDPKWKGKVALGYPLLGTIATHVAALYIVPGQEKTEAYLKALKANDVLIVNGNSVSRDLVVEGKIPIAFTDTDDANVAIQSGKSVRIIYPDRDGIGTLLIPNTVALIKGCPHPEEGKILIDYLLSREVEKKLAFSESANMPVRDTVEKPPHVPAFSSIKSMQVDYYEVANNLEKATLFCQNLFIR
ncbi:MAG: extracellular solute-binding protein [Proteobacteria bacterium]|nr:extracellular solute-binding protein [Pseudomonadota bacterium]